MPPAGPRSRFALWPKPASARRRWSGASRVAGPASRQVRRAHLGQLHAPRGKRLRPPSAHRRSLRPLRAGLLLSSCSPSLPPGKGALGWHTSAICSHAFSPQQQGIHGACQRRYLILTLANQLSSCLSSSSPQVWWCSGVRGHQGWSMRVGRMYARQSRLQIYPAVTQVTPVHVHLCHL